MSNILFSKYRYHDLKDLTLRLQDDYYAIINNECENTSGLLTKLQVIEEHPSLLLYISMCNNFLDELKEFVILRNEVLAPYIYELHRKNVEHHDCGNCAGGCHFQHSIHLSGIGESHEKIKELLYQMHVVAIPLYSKHKDTGDYKKLHDRVRRLDSLVTELFYLEEQCMLPKIIEAQKGINAYS